jgi:hypothetical protein
MIVLGLVTCVSGYLLLCMLVEACAALVSSCVHAKCAFVVCACKLFRPCDERVLLAPAHVGVSMRNTAVKLRACECAFVFAGVSVLGLVTCGCLLFCMLVAACTALVSSCVDAHCICVCARDCFSALRRARALVQHLHMLI